MYKLHPKIRFTIIDDIVLILDIKTGKYFGLNKSASRIWVDILKPTNSELPTVAKVIKFPKQNEVDMFIADSIKRNLIIRNNLSVPEDTNMSFNLSFLGKLQKLSNTLTATYCLWKIKNGLGKENFNQIYTKCQNIRRRYVKSSFIEKVENSFVRAENIIVLKNAPDDCLPRSLALYVYLVLLGFNPIHKIGVRRYPTISMHAWVELENQVIIDNLPKDTYEEYSIISTLNPLEKKDD